MENGFYYTLNRVGSLIWDSISGKHTLEDIAAIICEQFDVSEMIARSELCAFVTQLRQEV